MSKDEAMNIEFKRGQVYIANLGKDVVGSEQGGIRPVVILQNNIGNKYKLRIRPVGKSDFKRMTDKA
ncbi:MAG: hypothetical protein ATN32_06030 [Candidatus Epulonipiscium fishelsonii]|nr:MAG: hypothetical protein ATN32_06030 [Epulopiscium sp. AS2M-Bin002]